MLAKIVFRIWPQRIKIGTKDILAYTITVHIFLAKDFFGHQGHASEFKNTKNTSVAVLSRLLFCHKYLECYTRVRSVCFFRTMWNWETILGRCDGNWCSDAFIISQIRYHKHPSSLTVLVQWISTFKIYRTDCNSYYIFLHDIFNEICKLIDMIVNI